MELKELEKQFQKAILTDVSGDELSRLIEIWYSYLKNELAKNPKNVEVLIELGVLAWEPFHQQEEAIAYLENAIIYDPKNTEARFWLAKCYYHDYCDYQKVEDILLEALSIDPTKPECLALLAENIVDKRGDIDKSIACYQKAVDYAPDWPILRHSIARLYLKKKDIAAAMVHINYAFNHFTPLLDIPKNFIEYYYEGVVTGRRFSDIREDFKSLITKIQKLEKDNLC